jgi:WD40 repeat protein
MYLDVWQFEKNCEHSLAKSLVDKESIRDNLFNKKVELPNHVVRIRKCGQEPLISAAISASGEFIACSDVSKLRLFFVSCDSFKSHKKVDTLKKKEKHDNSINVKKLVVPQNAEPAQKLVFVPNSSQLITASLTGKIIVICVDSGEISNLFDMASLLSVHSGNTSRFRVTSQLTSLHVSPDGLWLAAVNRDAVHLYNIETKTYHKKIPAIEEKIPITAVNFNASSSKLVIANASNQIAAYTLFDGMPSWLSKEIFKKMPGTICGISHNPIRGSDNIIVFTSVAFCYIKVSKVTCMDIGKHKRKHQLTLKIERFTVFGEKLTIFKLENICLFLGFLGPNMVVLIEKSWTEVLHSLPEPIYRNVYGT